MKTDIWALEEQLDPSIASFFTAVQSAFSTRNIATMSVDEIVGVLLKMDVKLTPPPNVTRETWMLGTAIVLLIDQANGRKKEGASRAAHRLTKARARLRRQPDLLPWIASMGEGSAEILGLSVSAAA